MNFEYLEKTLEDMKNECGSSVSSEAESTMFSRVLLSRQILVKLKEANKETQKDTDKTKSE